MSTPQDRQRLREVEKRASRGPWGWASTMGNGFAVHHGEHDTIALYALRADAKFIAAAREAVPALLDELEAVERERDEARSEARTMMVERDVAMDGVGTAVSRAEAAEAKVARVRELAERWDAITKGPSPSSRELYAALSDSGAEVAAESGDGVRGGERGRSASDRGTNGDGEPL